MNTIRIGILLIFLLSFGVVSAQVQISGVVVDSLSFKSVPNVHIRIKHKNIGFVTDENGRFLVTAKPLDTLLFTAIGYVSLEVPVLFNEEDILILMSEEVTMLRDVLVYDSKIQSPLVQPKKEFVYKQPKAAKLVTGAGISFDYFSRMQRERRKLAKLIEANNKVSAYVHLITDPEYRSRIMRDFRLSEEQYYELILQFNTTKIESVEYKDEETVEQVLNEYFCKASAYCK